MKEKVSNSKTMNSDKKLNSCELRDTGCKMSIKIMAGCNKKLLECRATWVNKRSRWSNIERDSVMLNVTYLCRLNKIVI